MNAIPLKIHEATGKKHLTNAEKEARRESEVKVPSGEIVCPDYVKRDSAAFSKWNEVAPILTEADLLKPADAGNLARYCMTYSEYLDLIRLRQEVSSLEPFCASEGIELQKDMEDNLGYKRSKMLWDKFEFIVSAEGVIAFDKAVNQKLQILLSYEDHLFLNMLSRIKNVLKKPEEKKTPAETLGLKKTWA